MYSLIHYATASIMLLHALLGCCVHHDHCCAMGNPAAGNPAAGVLSAVDQHATCSHEHADPAVPHLAPPAEPGPPAEPAPHPCGSGDCVFLQNGVSVFAVDMACRWLDSHWLVESVEESAVKEFAGFESTHAPPLQERFQAQYCIWLI